MIKPYRFPIKGTYYYAAELAMTQHRLTTNATLQLQAEPDNLFDPYALQIWLPSHHPNLPGLLIGYVPRQLARMLHQTLQPTLHPSINAGARSQQNSPSTLYRLHLITPIHQTPRLQLECQLSLDQAWLNVVKMLFWCFLIRQQSRLQRLHYWFKSIVF
jgi:hypothetical protein